MGKRKNREAVGEILVNDELISTAVCDTSENAQRVQMDDMKQGRHAGWTAANCGNWQTEEQIKSKNNSPAYITGYLEAHFKKINKLIASGVKQEQLQITKKQYYLSLRHPAAVLSPLEQAHEPSIPLTTIADTDSEIRPTVSRCNFFVRQKTKKTQTSQLSVATKDKAVQVGDGTVSSIIEQEKLQRYGKDLTLLDELISKDYAKIEKLKSQLRDIGEEINSLTNIRQITNKPN